ncbi:MAG TPA: hypothetical protein VG456_22885 [Candidatus Sulfopaludibacter sp.]|jgi:hypothetical protein|nr:hypothetical protein [Candidatus Sulfopaludibacter sp.]
MLRRSSILGLLAALLASAQTPAKTDLPYLKQAASLIPLEAAEAHGEKGTTLYTIEGAESPVKTPIPLPIFFLKADKLAPDRLQLYKLDVKGGHRELAEVVHMEVSKQANGIWKLAAADTLDAGEYALSAGGAGPAFCFQVF